MNSNRTVKITALVLCILAAAFGSVYAIAWAIDVDWLQKILTPHFGRTRLPFPWNLAVLASLLALAFALRRISKRER